MRKDKFNPGDRVVIARPGPGGMEGTKGKHATILSQRQHFNTAEWGFAYGYAIEMDGCPEPIFAEERELDPVREGVLGKVSKAEVAA